MPGDSRRLPIPEESETPYKYAKQQTKVLDEPLINNGLRQDGRTPGEMRQIFAEVGMVSQSRGSSYIEIGQTKVICAVYGPREVTRRDEFSLNGQLLCEFKFATFCSRYRRQHMQDSEEKEYGLVIEQAMEPAVRLDKFPKARIDIFVTVLEDDGSALAAAISCASLALANAGVEMYDVVIGSSLKQYGDCLLLDSTANEEAIVQKCSSQKLEAINGSVTIGFMPSNHQISALIQKGTLSLPTSKQGIKMCIESCQQIYPMIQQCLAHSVKKRFEIFQKR